MISPLTEYAGLWRRSAAVLIDMLWIAPILIGLFYGVYGHELMTILNQLNTLTELENSEWLTFLMIGILPALFILWFWLKYAATPGKLLFDCEIVDAHSGNPIRVPQILLRYLSYFIYLLPLTLSWGCEVEMSVLTGIAGETGKTILCSIVYMLATLPLIGLLRISWDKQKQGWHDKIAHTVVIIHDEATLPLAQLDKYYR